MIGRSKDGDGISAFEIDEHGDAVFRVRTVGGPAPGDSRDGAMHQVWFDLPEWFDLEPLDEPLGGPYAHYVRSASPPAMDENGNYVWIYEYRAMPDSWWINGTTD